MSNYQKFTKHPETGRYEMADWLDNYFGAHRYGVRFPDGKIFKADDYDWETKDPDPLINSDIWNDGEQGKQTSQSLPETPDVVSGVNVDELDKIITEHNVYIDAIWKGQHAMYQIPKTAEKLLAWHKRQLVQELENLSDEMGVDCGDFTIIDERIEELKNE